MKNSALLAGRRLERFLGFDAFHDLVFFRSGSDKGFMTLYLGLRLAVLMGVVLRLFLNISDYQGASLRFALLSIAVFLLYIFVLAFLRAVNPDLFASSRSKLTQILVDVVLFSMFYLSTNDKESDLFILYSLPLLITARYFNTRISLMVLGFVSGALLFVVMETESLFALSSQQIVLKIFLPRVFFFVIVTAAWILSHLEKARLYDDMRDRALTLEALHDTSLEITKHLAREDLLQSIIQRAVKLLRAKGGGIYEYDPAQGELTVVADWGGKWSIVGNKLKGGEGMAGRVVQTGEPLIVDDYRTWSGRAPIYEPDLFRAVVEVPFRGEDRILGVLYVTDDAEGRVFSQQDAYLLGLLASQAAIAIENSRLLGESQQRANELQLLLDASATVASGRSLDEGLQRLAETVVRFLPTTFVYVAVLEQNDKALRIKAAHPIRDGLQWDPGVEQSYPLSTNLGDARAIEAAEPQVLCIVVHEDQEALAEIERRLKLSEQLQSACLIPLRSVNGYAFGVLCLGEVRKPERVFFGPQRIRLCKAMADQTAVIIERARLLDETERQLQEAQRKAQELKLVNQIAATVNSTLDLDQILQTAITEMAKVFGVKQGGVVIFDRVDGYGRVLAEYQEVKDSTAARIKIPLQGNPSMEWILTHKRPLAIEDAQNDPLLASVKDIVELRRIKSILIVPLLVKGEVFGTIGLDALDTPHVFTAGEIELAQTIANQVALAIENAQLFEQTRHRALALAALHETSLDITRYQRVPDLVKSILDRAVELLQAKGGGLYLLDESGELFKLAALSNLPDDFVGMTVRVGNGVVGQIIKTRTALSVSDYRNWPDRLRQYDEYGFTAVAGAPIAWQDKTWGVIAVHTDVEGRMFSREDLDLLSHLGNLAAVALENARRMDELERLMASAIDAVIAVDEEGKVVKFNEQAKEILGYEAEEVLGQLVIQLYYDPEEPRKVKRLLLESKDGRIMEHDTFVKGKDGERIPIRLSASLLFDYEGKPAGSVGFFRDLREIESAKRQIRQLGGLLAAGQAIISQLDLPTVLKSIVANAMGALDNVDAIVLYPYDPDKGEFQVPPVIKGVTQPDFISGPFNPESVVARVMEVGEAHFADNAPDDPVMAGDFVAREGIASSAAVPLKVGDKTVGIMFFNYRESHPFSEGVKSVINILANQAAIAIENARLYEETRQRAAQFQGLYQASLSLSAELSLDAALQKVVDLSRELAGAQYGALGVLDEAGEFEHFITSGLTGEERVHIDSRPCRRGLLDVLLREGDSLQIPDISKDPRAVEFPPHHPQMHNLLGVPLFHKGRIIGGLWLTDKQGAPEFTEEDQSLLEMLATEIAITIANARLYEETRRRLEELTLLHKVAMAASSTIEVDKVLQTTADTIAESLGYESAGIRLIEETGQLTGAAYYAGFQPQSLNFSRDKGIVGRVVREGRSALVPDVSKDPDYVASYPDTKSEMCVPLRTGERVIGAINAESTKLSAFTKHDLRLLETIAGHVVNWIENARLYTQLGKTKEILVARTAVAWLGMVSSTWAHKIRGYAQTIKNYIELLRPVFAESAAGREVLEKLDRMYAEAVKIQEIPLTAPLSTEEGIDDVDLNALLRERVGRLLEPYKGSITLELKLDPVNSTKVRANRLWFMRAFDILIDNAIDAMSESEVKTLTISTDAAGDSVKVHIVDTGGGVPPAVQPLLFKGLVPKSEGETGSGIGLLLASTILQAYGGDIALGPTGPHGTAFIVSLPKSHDLVTSQEVLHDVLVETTGATD